MSIRNALRSIYDLSSDYGVSPLCILVASHRVEDFGMLRDMCNKGSTIFPHNPSRFALYSAHTVWFGYIVFISMSFPSNIR